MVNLLKALSTTGVIILLAGIIIALLYFGYVIGIVIVVCTVVYIIYHIFKTISKSKL